MGRIEGRFTGNVLRYGRRSRPTQHLRYIHSRRAEQTPLTVDEPAPALVEYVGAAEYLSWLEDPAHTRGVVGSIPTSATIQEGDST